MSFTTSLGYTPTFSISKDGDDITSKIADRVISIRVESRDGGGEADVCDITLDDRGWDLASPSIGEGSATLSIALGYVETGLYHQGTFQVDEIYYEWTPKQIRLHGNSLGMTANAKAPIFASFDGQSLGDIIGAIAGSAGVAPVISAELSSIAVPYLNQSSSSMHLLQTLERQYGGLAKFSDGKLSFTKRGSGLSASGQSIGNFTLGPEDFGPGGCSLKATNQFGYSETRATWFDRTTNTTQTVTSAVPGNSGSSVPFLIRTVHPSQGDAQSAADSMMAQLNRRCIDGTLILAKGHAAIRGGAGFAIAGCRPGIDGTSYLVRRAVHTLAKEAGLSTVMEVYSEGGDIDFSQESTDGTLDFSAVPATILPADGIGHM